MNAKFTLLTHFSQRYAKLPIIDETSSSNVGIVFDNMRVNETNYGLICNKPKNVHMHLNVTVLMYTKAKFSWFRII